MSRFKSKREKNIELLTPIQVIAAQRKKAESTKMIKKFIGKLFLVVLVLLLVFNLVWGITIVQGKGMSPALKDGDLLFYYRLYGDLKIDDVIVYEKEGKLYQGRIVALPFEEVNITDKGALFVNDRQEETEVFYHTYKGDATEIEYPFSVPVDAYFVLGDYRIAANDSRLFGAITEDEILGKVIGSYRIRNI